ncbi:hypothetical protein AB6805_30495 [Chitinophaga sp. RCC_12]|uniref:hypothetical protein n=1 Tax=Chitinophaga sp. RCC_12 TaxID=3239226 RepID=UPI0035251979
MNILSKSITTTGALSISFLSESGVHQETFPAKEVQFYMYAADMIDDAHEHQVMVKGEGWVDYPDFLRSQLADNAFCEHILSTNALIK